MKNWTRDHLQQLKNTGRIRDFQAPPEKGYSQDTPGNQADRYRSKAKDWLGWNLPFFANEHAMRLEPEFKFAADRNWRFDWAFLDQKIAVEFEGGIFRQYTGQQGAHSSAKLYTKDTDKYNRATALGWRVLRATALNYTTIPAQLREILNPQTKKP